MKIIGLTGLTGSGKSEAAKVFAEKGAYIVNADGIGREILKKGYPAYNEALYFFGDSIIDENGDIIRKRLGDLVFPDTAKLNILNSITHKYIIVNTLNKVDEIRANPGNYKCVVIDAPLLIESGVGDLCDIIVVVEADDDLRLQRIMKRDGISAGQAQSRMKSQSPKEVLNSRADYIIDNNGEIADFRRRAEELADNVLCC